MALHIKNKDKEKEKRKSTIVVSGINIETIYEEKFRSRSLELKKIYKRGSRRRKQC